MGSWSTARSEPGCVWHHSNHSRFQWINLWFVPFWEDVGCYECCQIARFTGNKLPIKIKHETHPESQRSEAQIKRKATSTPMMRRARPPKVVFSLEIKLFREETNELHICTHYSEAELWSVAWLPVGQSVIGTIMCFLVAISCLLPIMWTCVRACSFADKCIPVLPALQAHAVLLSQDPEGVRVAPSGAGEDGESHHCETGGAEQRYFQGAVKVIHILHLRGNADALYQVRLFFI